MAARAYGTLTLTVNGTSMVSSPNVPPMFAVCVADEAPQLNATNTSSVAPYPTGWVKPGVPD